MKKDELFPSKYMKTVDVPVKGLTLTIGGVTVEELTDTETGEVKTKPIIHFAETPKGLILNKTNWESIEAVHGEESDGWKGKKITLVVNMVEAFGKEKAAIRVKASKNGKK